jgi:hypothetical protein
MKYLIITTLALLFVANMCIAQFNLKQLAGNWESVASEDLGNGTFGFRSFSFDGNNWEIRFTMYFDKEMTKPVFTFRGEGTFEIRGISKNLAANTADFSFLKKFITLKTADEGVIKSFGFADCKLVPHEEADISQSGCSFLPSVANYGKEYDLISLTNHQLFLGARPADGNMGSEDKRPIALGAPLKRR